jgi:hypothetical protein
MNADKQKQGALSGFIGVHLRLRMVFKHFSGQKMVGFLVRHENAENSL